MRRKVFILLALGTLIVFLGGNSLAQTESDTTGGTQSNPTSTAQPDTTSGTQPDVTGGAGFSTTGGAEPGTGTQLSISTSVTYRVDAEGGAGTLSEDVAAAFATWREVEGAGFTATESEDEAGAVVRYGDAAQFGPDTVSLTLSSSEGAGENAQRLTVLVNPDAPELRPAALLHETGVLIGVPASSAPGDVMNPALTPGAPAELTQADRDAVVSLETFVPEDLNRDGVVDFYDLTRFGAAFGQTGVNIEGDFNGDGTVDETDLALLEAAYVFAPPSETAPATFTEADVSGGGLSGGSGGLDEGTDENPVDENFFGTGGATTGGADAGIGTGGADEGSSDGEVTGGATGGS